MILDTKDQRITEIIEDTYNLSSDNKKEIITKYNLNCSKKLSDIKQALYDLGDSYRKEHKVYSKEDWAIWNRKWDAPYSYKKIKEACKEEPIEWIDFCIKVTKIKAYPKDYRNNYFIKLKNEIINSNDNILEDIYDKLTILTFSFKEKLYNHFIKTEFKRFKYIASLDFSTKEKIEENRQLYVMWLKIKDGANKFDWETYKAKLNDEFERFFDSNIKNIAKRIRPYNIKAENLKLIKITEDPKFFEMILRDNLNRTIHCRSIIAAEYSNIVATHYRFIITIRENK